MTKIAVLVGSLSSASINKKLAKSLEELAPAGTEFVYADLDLPLFDYELEADFPKKAQDLKDVIEAADGVLLVTPEYNRSFSGVLKNAIDWASRPYGKNAFSGKPAVIVGASVGALGTTQAQSQLRSVMVHLNTRVIGQPELYANASKDLDVDGQVTAEAKEGFKNVIDNFVDVIEAQK